MKKFIVALLFCFLSFASIAVMAQNTVAKQSKSSSTKLKKDGTPDKRFRENKTTGNKKPTKHLKKDGTPDKRYKENKK